MNEGRPPRLERWLAATFLLLTAVFLIEVYHYAKTGVWVIVGGRGAFARWPVLTELHTDINLHALGMLVWMGVVIHQLWTRGSGQHRQVGRVGALLMLGAIACAARPSLHSEIPALHGALGLTMQDWTVIVAGVGISEELAIGVYKVRRKDVEAHRRHLTVSVLFTAAPGVYRLGVIGLTAALGLDHPDAPVWASTWVHEMAQCIVLLLAMATVLTPWLGAHLGVLRNPGEHDVVERSAAWIMVPLCALMALMYGLWLIDLLAMWGGDQPLLERGEVSAFVLYMVGS